MATFLMILKKIVWFCKDNWKVVLPIFAVLIIAVFVYRACNKPPKLDEEAIRKAQAAIAKEDRKEMIEILAASDVKEQGVDDSIKAIENATEQSKKNYTGLTNDQLAEELNKRAMQ